MELDEGDQAVLDELWDGDFLLPDDEDESMPPPPAGGSAFGAAAGEDGAVAPPAQRAFRCLDSSHTAGCRLCTAPPCARDASRWELRGDPGCVRALRPRDRDARASPRCGAGRRSAPVARRGTLRCLVPSLTRRRRRKRNGEKRLRSLLTRTVEWRSSAERLRAASALEATSSSLAAALRKRSSSDLGKVCMLRLLDLWGYKCNLWVPRGNRQLSLGKRSARSAAQDATARLPARLDPLLNEYARLMLGVATKQLAERSAAAREAFARELPRMERNNTMMKTVWEPFLRKLITRCRASGTPSASDTALCGQIARHALDTYTKFLAHYQAALAEPEVSVEARCWLDEIIEVNSLMVQYYTHIADAFAACAADAEAAARLASTVLPYYVQYVSVAIGANTARIEWVTEMCPADSAASGVEDSLAAAMAAVTLTPDIDKLAMATPELVSASSSGA